MLPNPWKTLAAVVADPYTGWTARYPGRRAFGVLCTYAPEEILHAAGFVPVRLLPLPSPLPDSGRGRGGVKPGQPRPRSAQRAGDQQAIAHPRPRAA